MPSPEERQQKGKPNQGTLTLRIEEGPKFYEIYYSDDGRGLDLERIQTIGFEKELLTKSDHFSAEGTAELIFQSGFSTAASVTNISGRGVGMDAVRSYVENNGGRIDIRMPNPPDQPVATPFAFHICVPKTLFKKMA